MKTDCLIVCVRVLKNGTSLDSNKFDGFARLTLSVLCCFSDELCARDTQNTENELFKSIANSATKCKSCKIIREQNNTVYNQFASFEMQHM